MRKAYLAYLLILLATALYLTACWPRGAALPTLVPTLAPTSPPPGRPISFAEIINVVETRPSEANVFVLAGLGQNIGPGAQVRTGEISVTRINLDQGGILRLAPKSLITIMGLPTAPDDPLARIRLWKGKIWMTLKAGGVEVETPAGVAALRGTYAEFEYWPGVPDDPTDDVMVVRCLEGVCGVQGTAGPLIVLGRMELVTLTTNNQPPSRAVLGLEAIAEFVKNNPDSADLVATLTASAPSETPTPTPTLTASASATTTPTPSATATGTPTRTRTPGTLAPTRTNTPVTVTPTRTRTPSVTPTLYPSLTPSRTFTPPATATLTAPAPSRTPTATVVTGTSTAPATATATPTLTSPPVQTSTATETATSLPTSTYTATATDTDTPLPTLTATDTPTPMPAATATDTPTPTTGP